MLPGALADGAASWASNEALSKATGEAQATHRARHRAKRKRRGRCRAVRRASCHAIRHAIRRTGTAKPPPTARMTGVCRFWHLPLVCRCFAARCLLLARPLSARFLSAYHPLRRSARMRGLTGCRSAGAARDGTRAFGTRVGPPPGRLKSYNLADFDRLPQCTKPGRRVRPGAGLRLGGGPMLTFEPPHHHGTSV